MQTNLAPEYRDTHDGREADAILRSCVHCGFCNATCPTYQLLGDELDGPRGRIYLIKQVLEGEQATAKTQLHLDRCLTCRNCETTCPSGVQYGRLVDIGRRLVEAKVGRTPTEAAQRYVLRKTLMSRSLFGGALTMGRLVKGLLPRELADHIPSAEKSGEWPAPRHQRKMLIMEGCVQPSLKPNIDAACARVLDRIGISPLRVAGGGCCGQLLASSRRRRRSARRRPAQHRRVVAARPSRARGDRRHGERMRRDGQGIRPLPRARRGLRGQGARRSRSLRAIRSRS